ncbi:peptidoglycan-recognition protein SB2-like [Macrosteles quadrilineatus]|uniref:peptidoglycan-recognition protein SB2-like n=1 Tax=Macrosteles quadrilineatus TaxID=74068 RepID=UPI0023E29992|nr:peptidoglycan-recognition protein SB2-like [Macrosteles quadrilineatus]
MKDIRRRKRKTKPGHPFIPLVREFWGALPYRNKPKYIESPVSNVLIYDYDYCRPCVSDFDCTREVQAIQLRERRRRLPDLKYNFLIGGMGRVYEGRGWHIRPQVDEQHADIEDDCLLIALIGKEIDEEFGTRRKMRFKMMRGLEEFLRFSVEHRYISPNFLQYNASRTSRQGAVDIPDHILKMMAKPEPRPKLMF